MAARVKDTDKGFRKLMGSLGEMGTLTIGVQGQEAERKHPESNLTIGELARMHELGQGVPKRSFITAWFDQNEPRLIRQTKQAVERVLRRQTTRKVELAGLGYLWTDEIRRHIDANEVAGPALAASTQRRKGHGIKLLGFTYALRNSITYKLFMPQIKSVRNTEQRMALRKQ